ncbi:MAG: GNAT family N-acetyltransferase [Pseudomonadota bacterium]
MRVGSDLIDGIMLVMEQAFDPVYGEAWNRRQISDALAMPNTHALVVDGNGRFGSQSQNGPAGFVLTRNAPGEEELLLIAVHPHHRGKGLAKLLIDQLFVAASERGADRIFLEMRRGNPAVRLYEKAGFEPIGLRPNYYRTVNGERIDAITFGKSI